VPRPCAVLSCQALLLSVSVHSLNSIYGWKADEILVPEHQAPDQFSANENFMGLFTGGGFLNTSWYFIGGYTLAHDDYGTGETEADQVIRNVLLGRAVCGILLMPHVLGTRSVLNANGCCGVVVADGPDQ
jgi:hypothetical protein